MLTNFRLPCSWAKSTARVCSGCGCRPTSSRANSTASVYFTRANRIRLNSSPKPSYWSERQRAEEGSSPKPSYWLERQRAEEGGSTKEQRCGDFQKPTTCSLLQGSCLPFNRDGAVMIFLSVQTAAVHPPCLTPLSCNSNTFSVVRCR